MIIRNIKEVDIPEYIRLVNQVWNETYRGIVDDSFLDNMENTTEDRIKRQKEKYKNNELKTVYVMLDDDRLIGYTSINHSRDEYYSVSGEISSLYLLKDYQGKGLGNKLFNYSLNKLILKGYRDYIISCLDKNKEQRVSKMIPAEKSIEYRPKEALLRNVYGYLEGDLVVGKQGTKTVLFTLTERMTRQEIIMKLPNKETATIAKALDKIERRYGSEFYKTFKSITFDNGVEFMGYKGLEKSCLRKKKRTEIYYAHPYCSGERGTNENNNRLIRRWIPKGIDMKDIKVSFIKEIENWINNYPRAMFDYRSSNDILLNI